MSTKTSLRAGYLLGFVIVLGVFFIPEKVATQTSLATISLFSPVIHPIARESSGIADWVYRLSAGTSQNEKMQAEIASLKEQLLAEKAQTAEKDRLIEMLNEFRPRRRQISHLTAEIIGEGAGLQSRTIFIDRGSADGIRKGFAILAGNSLIGIVASTSEKASAITLVTAKESAVYATLTRTGESGIVAGNGNNTLSLKYISKTDPVIGDGIVTHGRNGLVPPGLVIGTITQVKRQPGLLTWDITLEPVRRADRISHVIAVIPAVTAKDFPAPAGGDR